MALFAADGMELDPALIPEDTAVSVYTLTRDEALEKKVAAYLLGETPEGASRAGGHLHVQHRPGRGDLPGHRQL